MRTALLIIDMQKGSYAKKTPPRIPRMLQMESTNFLKSLEISIYP